MRSFPTAAVAAGSLIGGYLVARETKIRPLGGAVLLAGGSWCMSRWLRRTGPAAAITLAGIYLGAFGASHPLARRIGAWPSVLSVAGVSAAASWMIADRPS